MDNEKTGAPVDIDDPTVHHVPQRKKRQKNSGSESMELNLTSMIDVVFLLLIYFVVTAGFAQPEGVLSTKLPAGQSKQTDQTEPPKQKLKIFITAPSGNSTKCQIYVQSRDPNHSVDSFSALASKLASLQYDPSQGRTSGTFKPDDPVVIVPSEGVRWQHVVNAFNAAVRNKFTNVAFSNGPSG